MSPPKQSMLEIPAPAEASGGGEEGSNGGDVDEAALVKAMEEVDSNVEMEEKGKGKKKKSTVADGEPRLPRGLPHDVQRALAQAIENEGGIRWFAQFGCVKTLCDSNLALFGDTGSKRREQVRNRVSEMC